MNWIKKLFALVVTVLAALGFALCAVGLVATWISKEPVTQTLTGALSTVERYSTLAGEATQIVNEKVSEVRADVNALSERLASLSDADRADFSASARQRLDEVVLPKLERARTTARTVAQTAVNVNDALVTANRFPGINVPTFTDELQTAGALLEDARSAAAGLRAAVSEVDLDAGRVRLAIEGASNKLDTVQAALTKSQADLALVGQAVASVNAQVPGWINGLSVVLTALLILFGAGQAFLFKAGLDWFRRS